MNIIKPMKTIATISALCTAMAFSGVAMSASDIGADAPKHMHNKSIRSEQGMMKRMSRALALSEQQQNQIKAIHTQAKKQHTALRDDMKKFKKAEKVLLQAKSFDEQAYIALHEANQQNFTALALARAKKKHAVFNVLTTEQQEKWLKIMKKQQRKKAHRKSRASNK